VPKEAKEACQRKALDCFPKKAQAVCAFSLRIKNHGFPSENNQGQSPCMQARSACIVTQRLVEQYAPFGCT